MRDRKAFTIIEVVLVLAVAGLIFLVVFAAIPRLQASRRDNQRKRDFEALWASFIEFESNVGRVPNYTEVFNALHHTNTASGAFLPYVPLNFEDPSAGARYDRVGAWSTFYDTPGSIVYYDYGTCTPTSTNPATRNTTSNSINDIAVTMSLERGNVCLDNQ